MDLAPWLEDVESRMDETEETAIHCKCVYSLKNSAERGI